MIFEALHRESQEKYAIKIMLPTKKEEEVSHRFHQEYKALSRLKHPNVLRVVESGIHEEKPYFVMELLKGKILKEEILTLINVCITHAEVSGRMGKGFLNVWLS